MVLAHEIGHTLGLTHSPAPQALMAPYYKKLGRDALLSWDDVLAVQSLYGEPLGSSDSGSSNRISPTPPLFSSSLRSFLILKPLRLPWNLNIRGFCFLSPSGPRHP